MNIVTLHVPPADPMPRTSHRLIPTQHLRESRKFHVLDIENLCNSAHLTESLVRFVMEAYRRAVGIGRSDHVVIGVSHHNLFAAYAAEPTARFCVRSGPDGADLALLAVLDEERVSERFSHVMIGSGDGAFTDAAAWLGGRGVHVTVAAIDNTTSRRLRLAARTFIPLFADALSLRALSIDLNSQEPA